MHSHLALYVAVAVTLSTLQGCTSIQRAKENHLLADARQILAARYHMIAEDPNGRVPSLADVMVDHPILDSDRVAPFEVTPAWDNPDAQKEIILQQKDPAGGRRVVALGNGSVLVIKE